jgi:hypothetical protein
MIHSRKDVDLSTREPHLNLGKNLFQFSKRKIIYISIYNNLLVGEVSLVKRVDRGSCLLHQLQAPGNVGMTTDGDGIILDG